MYILDEAFRNNCFGVDEELIHDDNFMYDDCLCNIDDRELMECLQWHCDADEQISYVNLPMTEENPLSTKWLKTAQDSDQALQLKLIEEPEFYHRRNVSGTELICYQPQNENWKICLTNDNVDAAIEFMHKLLCYPGQNQLRRGMRVYHHPQLTRKTREYKDDTGQRVKSGERGFGHLAPRDVTLMTWECTDVDLIGPWKIKVGGTRRSAKVYEFSALTCIDRVSGFPDGCRIDRKTAPYVAEKFKQCWLSRYPRPCFVGHDNGGEFLAEFRELLDDYAITDVPTTSRNPTGNSVCERLHLTVGNVLRALTREQEPKTLKEAELYMDSALATAFHAVRINVSETRGNSPGAIVFHRDMLHNIPVQVDLGRIQQLKQLRVDEDLMRANAKRHRHDYKVGERVLKRKFEYVKLEDRWEGPYEILQVHCNNTITIQRMPGASERINIRRVKPYREPTPSVLHPARP